MKLSPARFTQVLVSFKVMQLLEAAHLNDIMSIFAREFPFKAALMTADGVWVQVRVPSVMDLPYERIAALATEPQEETDGYVRFAFEGGLELIFSSSPAAEEDRQPGAPKVREPRLDNVGFVFQQAVPALDQIATQAAEAGWNYAVVKDRQWAFPPQGRPVGFSLGSAPREGELRPLTPAAGGGTPAAPSAAAPTDPIAAFVAAATGGDGALNARDRAVAALAVAHALRHVGLIETWSKQCSELGVSDEQRRDAAGVAAALAAAAVYLR